MVSMVLKKTKKNPRIFVLSKESLETMISFLLSLSTLLLLLVAVTRGAEPAKATCLVNGYESKLQIPIGSGYSVATLKVVAADDQAFVRATALTSAVVTLQAYVFATTLENVPKLADGSVDLMHKSGQLIDASGGHYEIRNATDLTIFFTATCPTGGLDGFACKFLPSPLNCDVSAAIKRDGQFHVPIIYNRRTTELALKEGQFVFFYGRGDVEQQKKLYYSIKKPIYQSVGVMGFVESVVVPHFSTNPDDLPTTDSGILGTSYDLPKDSPIIIGLFVKKANTISSTITEFTLLKVNFGLGSEPTDLTQPFAQFSCPEISRNGVVLSGGSTPATTAPTGPTPAPTPMPSPPPDTCANAEKLQPVCVGICAAQANKPFVKKCSCAPGMAQPVVECTGDDVCKAILKDCTKVCGADPYLKCECNLDPTSANPLFDIACGEKDKITTDGKPVGGAANRVGAVAASVGAAALVAALALQ
jgi:hypothetical protein